MSPVTHKAGLVVEVMGLIRTNHLTTRSVTKYEARFFQLVTQGSSNSEIHFVADRHDGLNDVKDKNGGNVCFEISQWLLQRSLFGIQG